MIKIKSRYDFWSAIKVSTPATDGGTQDTTFEVQFLYEPLKSKKMLKKIMDALPNRQEELGLEFLQAAITNWRGVSDEGGKELLFSKKVLVQILATPWIATAILEAWTEAINGNPALGN